MVERLPTVGDDNNAWGSILNSFLGVGHNETGTLLGNMPVFNVKDDTYGAAVDGSTNDTTAIQAAITAAGSAGGGFVLIPGTAALSSGLTIASQNVYLLGVPGSVLKARSDFSDTEMVAITADHCGIFNLRFTGGPNTSSATNPATNGVAVTGARYAKFENMKFFYVNGWAIESIGTASVNCVGCMIHNLLVEHCTKGIHALGVSGSSWVGQWYLTNIHLQQLDNGDGLFIEDINDILVSNINGATSGAATNGSMIHIKGHSASHFITNVDVGQMSQGTANPTVLIESGTNGSPSNIAFNGGIIQKGSVNVSITGGSNISFRGINFQSPNTDNVAISGSTVATPLNFEGCIFKTGNQSNGTAYDINLTHSTGYSYFRNCTIQSPVGTGAGSVTNPVNDTSHRGFFFFSHFAGTGTTGANTFATTPYMVRGCPGYNPRGSITPPSIGTSPVTGNAAEHDIAIVFTAVNGMTDFKIGATSIGGVPVAFTSYRIPARQSWEIDHNGSAPTWLWFAE